MSDNFQGRAAPTIVPAPAALPKSDGSRPGLAVEGMYQAPPPFKETPGPPVEFSAPLTTPTKPAGGRHGLNAGPLSPNHQDNIQAQRDQLNALRTTLGAPAVTTPLDPSGLVDTGVAQVAGTIAGREVVSDASQNKLFRVLSPQGHD